MQQLFSKVTAEKCAKSAPFVAAQISDPLVMTQDGVCLGLVQDSLLPRPIPSCQRHSDNVAILSLAVQTEVFSLFVPVGSSATLHHDQLLRVRMHHRKKL